MLTIKKYTNKQENYIEQTQNNEENQNQIRISYKQKEKRKKEIYNITLTGFDVNFFQIPIINKYATKHKPKNRNAVIK